MRMYSLALLALAATTASGQLPPAPPQPHLGQRHVTLLTVDGLQFKDLNHNGRLDPYEDWRLTPEARAHDLVGRMAIEDLAGLMVHGTLPGAGGDPVGRGSAYDFDLIRQRITQTHINTFITRMTAAPQAFAEASNRIQEIAETSDFGVPVLISTDPRSHFLYVPGASVEGGGFSKWPETTGLAAIGSAELVRHFADIVRQEYRAVGIREALSPQADLATEPRWPRMNGTFGEDAETARCLVEAYIEGMQAGAAGLNAGSVATVVKHWVGYGAQKDGLDSHNAYGRYASFAGDNFAYHLIPFTGAFQAHVAAVMPTYSILLGVSVDGKPLEQVGGGFNAQLLQGLLRGRYGFEGVVLSDFAITNDCDQICQDGVPAGQQPDFTHLGMPWGVEQLTQEQRYAKAVTAGVDQIGGSDQPRFLLDAARDGLLARPRMEEAAYRILLEKFQMGLFEDPYVDPAQAAATVGRADWTREGEAAQKRSLVLLENKGNLLPVHAAGRKVWLFGVDPAAATRAGFTVVPALAEANLAIIRAETPSEKLHPGYPFGNIQHEGRLDFRAGDPAYNALMQASAAGVPAVFTVYLDRPAILTNIAAKASAILGNFGISDTALLEALTGAGAPCGHLPFELPSSMQAVQAQKGDIPHDSAQPLYRYGFGLSYSR